MRRKPNERDETDPVSLEDTQEYFTAPQGSRPRRQPDPEPELEPETEVISDETAEYEAFPEAATETTEFDEFEDDGDYLDGDEYLEDDEFYEEPLDEAPIDIEPEPAEKKDGPEPVLERMKIAWASLIADAKKIDLPGGGKGEKKPKTGKAKASKAGDKTPVAAIDEVEAAQRDPQAGEDGNKAGAGTAAGFTVGRVGAIAAVLVVALAVGIGAYLIGKGSGEDVTAAKLEGAAAGKKAGAIEGAAKGYPAGFQKGRDAGFNRAYVRAYRIKYKEAFEQAGQDAPADKDIDVPDP